MDMDRYCDKGYGTSAKKDNTLKNEGQRAAAAATTAERSIYFHAGGNNV